MKHLLRKALVVGITTLVAATAFAQYPNRPVTVLVPWGAGGGTDYHARTMAALLEKELKQPFTVVNRTGGSGVVGHSAIAEAAPDGYTIGTVTVEINMMHWMGLTKLTHADYTPIGLDDIVEVERLATVPVFCIGGVNLKTLPQVIAAGAQRVVIVSAFLLADDVRAMVREAKEMLVDHSRTHQVPP